MTEPRRQPLQVFNPNDKVEQVRRAAASAPAGGGAGGLGRFLPHAQREAKGRTELEGRIIEALRLVYDPEIPVNIYDLGLVYEIDMDAGGSVKVAMTLTSPGCPVAGMLVKQVETRVRAVGGVTGVNVDLVWEPAWSKEMLSEEARLALGLP